MGAADRAATRPRQGVMDAHDFGEAADAPAPTPPLSLLSRPNRPPHAARPSGPPPPPARRSHSQSAKVETSIGSRKYVRLVGIVVTVVNLGSGGDRGSQDQRGAGAFVAARSVGVTASVGGHHARRPRGRCERRHAAGGRRDVRDGVGGRGTGREGASADVTSCGVVEVPPWAKASYRPSRKGFT